MPRVRSSIAFVLHVAILLSGLTGHAHAQVTCFISADPVTQRLKMLSASDATAALPVVQAELQVAKRMTPLDPDRIAQLIAVQAESFSVLERDSDARASALAGLALVPEVKNPVHLELLAVHAENVYDEAGLAAATIAIEAARASLAPDSIMESCLRVTLGTLQHRQDRADLAVVNLMHAYRNGVQRDREVQRKLAASSLSKVMRDMGDYTLALALNAEVIEWDLAHHANLSLSVSRFLRGSILQEMREFPAAISEYNKARALSVDLDDTQGVAFSDMNLCEVHIALMQLIEARKRCDNALTIFGAAGSSDLVKQTRSHLAYIDLEEGDTASALATLSELLENGAADMPPREVAPLLKLRSRANAALGNFRESYVDLEEYLRRTTAADDARRIRQAATLRARFEMDRQLERNTELNRELGAAQEKQQQQKWWTAIVTGTGAIIITLLAMHVISIRRHRRQLALLANTDGLTHLPNRRRTYELGKAALAEAAAAQRPLTVAVIDLDHFKSINDRFGHAGGDTVLLEFARVCRESIRESDILGRWGGEEFLIVMPGATLDVAMIALERLRQSALGIALPGIDAGLRVSMSAGLAAYENNVNSLDDLIARADAALYRAKNDGRDLVRIAEEDFAAASSGVRRSLR